MTKRFPPGHKLIAAISLTPAPEVKSMLSTYLGIQEINDVKEAPQLSSSLQTLSNFVKALLELAECSEAFKLVFHV